MNEESLFAAALDRAAGDERRAFLEAACAGDVALLRRVELLLAAHDETTGILDRTAGPPRMAAVTALAGLGGTTDSERAGTIIAGRYKLLEVLGVGGMGTVWKAEQTQPVRRTVALKLIKAGMDSRNVLARFEAERQALALMDHPNIAKVLDGGTTEGGRPFFAMEYVKGISLTQYCDDARLNIVQRLELFVPVCQAVQHAHTKGVIHRDLKPNNILVCLYDGRPVPKVIDFGLAKATREPLTERTLYTAHGVLLGTPLYMSPEQAEFNNLDVDARSDIYALGVILYELLTGTTPLEGRRFREAAWLEMLRLIKEEEPPPPSARLSETELLPTLAAQRQVEPVRLTRMIRGELDWIVMKCLEKDRSRRYETASGLARDVQRYLTDEPVEASPPSARYRLGKFARRHKGPMLAASMIFLLLIGGIVGTTWGMIRADRAWKAEADRAEGEWKANEKAQKRLKQIEKGSVLLASVFKDLDPLSEENEGRPLRMILGDRLDRAAVGLEGDAVGDPLVVANLQARLGQTYRALGHAAKAKAILSKALETRRVEAAGHDTDTFLLMYELARATYDVGEVNEALAMYEQVRDLQIMAIGADHQDTLATQHSLAVAYWRAGRAIEACTLLEQVRDGLTKKFGPDDDRTIDALDSLSAAYMTVSKETESIALARQVRAARVRNHGADHTLAIASLNSLAQRYQASGKMSQALALFEQARDELIPRLAVNHPTTLTILDSLAGMYRASGRADEAIALAERVRGARVMMLGAYNQHTIHTMWSLGLAYKDKGDLDKSLDMFLQAAVGLEKINFTYGKAGILIEGLCDSLESRGQLERSDEWRWKWLAASKKKHGPGTVAYAADLAEQGEYLLRRGRHADVEPILSESVAILKKKQPEAWTTFYAQSLLGGALVGLGKHTDAEPLLLQGYEGLKAYQVQNPSLYTRFRVADACRRIVELYEALGRTETAAEWRAKLPKTNHTLRSHAGPKS